MNEPRRRGPVARVLVGIWDAMNFTRRLIFNLLFFALLLFVLALLATGESTKPLLERTTLVIAPQGRIVEQYSIDPVSRALSRMSGDRTNVQVQLRDILRAIEAAKDDARIERVYLDLDGLQPSGIAPLREVAAALRDLRESGKQVVAFGHAYGQDGYLLAAQADEERVHAAKIADHILARGGRVQLGQIENPGLEVDSPLDAFSLALEHEQQVSEMIRNLARVAEEVQDFDSRTLMNWFLNEQIEEEDHVSGIIDQLRMVGDDGAGLLRIDARLGAERSPATSASAAE